MPMFTVNLPLVPLAVGDTVDRHAWVPHVTLIGNFLAPGPGAAAEVVRAFAARTAPIRFEVGEEAWFGPDRTVLVDLVEVPLLRRLHTRLLGELEAGVDGLEMLLPHHTREEYRPHRTVTAGPRPSRGDVLEADSVALVELDPPGRPGVAVVLGSWPLQGARQQA